MSIEKTKDGEEIFMKYVKNSLFITIGLLFFPERAFAYLDPGTGSMLVSAIIGMAATLLFFIKGIYYKGISFLYSCKGKKVRRESHSFVFYSEGSQYWNVFKPILTSLSERNEPSLYLTSDENDPGLSFSAEGVQAIHIGKGNKAFSVLNMLEADVCVLTTPGLDVLQLRRSPGVKHYAHVVHAAGEVSLYRLFGLDYYDSLLSSGPHQEKSVRALEDLRGTKPKLILQSGCPYFDVLCAQKKEFQEKLDVSEAGSPRILVAPTWGSNGLLSRYGLKLLLPLAEAGYKVTIRPHPQSRAVEQDLLKEMESGLQMYPNVSWDNAPSGFASMLEADIMISDYSSVIFDFAFIMERPVLTMDFTPELGFYDAYDLSERPWDFDAHEKIGYKITLEDIEALPRIVSDILEDPDFKQKIRKFREQNVYNFGCSGPVIAQQLIKIRNDLRQKFE